jgi:hypothetical protein
MKYEFALLAVAFTLPLTFNAAGAAETMQHVSIAEICKVLTPCLPPPQYDSGPFLMPPVVIDVPLSDIQQICGNGYKSILGNRPELPTVMGCAAFEADACVVHVPSDIKQSIPDLYRAVLRHELGHCRGWVHADYASAE